LQDKDSVFRQNAASSISAFEGAATSAVPSLIQMVRTDTGLGRANAIRALDRIGSFPEPLIPVIQAALDYPDNDVREAAREV
jgi:hypothetical protein